MTMRVTGLRDSEIPVLNSQDAYKDRRKPDRRRKKISTDNDLRRAWIKVLRTCSVWPSGPEEGSIHEAWIGPEENYCFDYNAHESVRFTEDAYAIFTAPAASVTYWRELSPLELLALIGDDGNTVVDEINRSVRLRQEEHDQR